MSYIGKAPGFGIRNRYYYTATASQTLFSGADDNGQTLAYADSKYLDVYLNGVLLVAGTDYTATTLTSVTLTSGASASDIIEIVAYDIFSVADTVSAANGGTFNGAVTFSGGANFGDNDKAIFGAGSDLQIYHDGTNSYVEDAGTGVLVLKTNGTHVYINGTSETLAKFEDDGAVSLYYDDSIKLATTASGVTVTGGVSFDAGSNYLDDYEEGTFTPNLPNITLGNGSVSGLYTKIGSLVMVQIFFVMGSTTSFGGSFFLNNLPFAVSGTLANQYGLMGNLLDAGTDNYIAYGRAADASTNGFVFYSEAGSSGTANKSRQPNTTAPFTWAVNDKIECGFVYYTDA